jgi:hypothetical protein
MELNQGQVTGLLVACWKRPVLPIAAAIGIFHFSQIA